MMRYDLYKLVFCAVIFALPVRAEIWLDKNDSLNADTKKDIIENNQKVKELYFYKFSDPCSNIEATRTNDYSKCYADGGELKFEISYKNGKRDGIIKKYFINGATAMDGNYTNDKMNGKITFYYPSGRVYKQFNMVEDKINGKYVEYDEYHNLHKEMNFQNGSLHGTLKEYGYDYNNERYIVLEANYKDGKLNGKFRAGNEQGIMEKGSYVNGKLDGIYQLYAVPEVLLYNINFDKGTAISGNNYCHSEIGVQDWAIQIPWNTAQILTYNNTGKIPSCPQNWDNQGKLIMLSNYKHVQ